jgi:hypothetical protein
LGVPSAFFTADVVVFHRIVIGGLFDQRHGLIRVEGLHHALRNQGHGQHQRNWQQDVEHAARGVDPEVADGGALTAREAADQRDQDRHADRGGDEVLHRQAEHLRQVAHGALAAIALPVGIGGEADRGIERGIGRHRGQFLRVQRQQALQALQRVHREGAEQVEQHEGDGIHRPGHLLLGLDAADAVDGALGRAEDAHGPGGTALINGCHVGAERLDQQQQDDQIQPQLRNSIGSHQNFSGLSMAYTRYTARMMETINPIQ